MTPGAGRSCARVPFSPRITWASGTESPTTPKGSFQLATEQRMRTICTAIQVSDLERAQDGYELLDRHPKQKPNPALPWTPQLGSGIPFALNVSATLRSSFSAITRLDPREGLTLMGIQHRTSKTFCKYMPALSTEAVIPVFPATPRKVRVPQRYFWGPEELLCTINNYSALTLCKCIWCIQEETKVCPPLYTQKSSSNISISEELRGRHRCADVRGWGCPGCTAP